MKYSLGDGSFWKSAIGTSDQRECCIDRLSRHLLTGSWCLILSQKHPSKDINQINRGSELPVGVTRTPVKRVRIREILPELAA